MNDTDRKRNNQREKTCPAATVSTTNPMTAGLGVISCVLSKRPANNNVSYGTAPYSLLYYLLDYTLFEIILFSMPKGDSCASCWKQSTYKTVKSWTDFSLIPLIYSVTETDGMKVLNLRQAHALMHLSVSWIRICFVQSKFRFNLRVKAGLYLQRYGLLLHLLTDMD
jgi:hypothetical protein